MEGLVHLVCITIPDFSPVYDIVIVTEYLQPGIPHLIFRLNGGIQLRGKAEVQGNSCEENGRLEKHIATAESLGLRKIGQTTIQPDNTQTRGKIAKIGYLLQVTEVE